MEENKIKKNLGSARMQNVCSHVLRFELQSYIVRTVLAGFKDATDEAPKAKAVPKKTRQKQRQSGPRSRGFRKVFELRMGLGSC